MIAGALGLCRWLGRGQDDGQRRRGYAHPEQSLDWHIYSFEERDLNAKNVGANR